MHIDLRCAGSRKNLARRFDTVGRIVGNDQKAVSGNHGLVLQHAVLGDADAIERGRKRADPADRNRAFQRSDEDCPPCEQASAPDVNCAAIG